MSVSCQSESQAAAVGVPEDFDERSSLHCLISHRTDRA